MLSSEIQFAKDRAGVDLALRAPISQINPQQPGTGKRIILVAWHVIYASQTLSGGYLPDSAITESIRVLNRDFNSIFKFVLFKTTRTLSSDWFWNAGYDNQKSKDMRNYLHDGPQSMLNVYSVSLAGAGVRGFATMAAEVKWRKREDGAVIRWDTVPGGGGTGPYTLGRTLTHEVGHWAGLHHPFGGDCGDADFVADTPPQKTETYGCPTYKDTCPGGGPDSIHKLYGLFKRFLHESVDWRPNRSHDFSV